MDVVPLTAERFASVGAMLGRAFSNDPAWSHVFPDAARRQEHLAWFFTKWIRAMVPLGASFVTSGGEGVAVWFPPGTGPHISTWATIRTGLVMAPLRFGMGWMRRSTELLHDLEKRHKADLEGPQWILDVLAVDPDHQRKGVGSALLQPIFERADQDGLPCYVVTHNPANIPYYERHGFRLLHRAEGGPYACSLRRPISGGG